VKAILTVTNEAKTQRKTQIMFSSPPYYQRPYTDETYSSRPKYLNAGTLAVAMFVASALFTSARGKDSKTRDSAPTRATSEVIINNFSFSPNALTLPIGATVTWANHDAVAHIIASADNRFRESPALKPGQNFSHTFATAGSYPYFCSIHPRMKGEITVK